MAAATDLVVGGTGSNVAGSRRGRTSNRVLDSLYAAGVVSAALCRGCGCLLAIQAHDGCWETHQFCTGWDVAAADDASLVHVLLPHLRACAAGPDVADGIRLLAALDAHAAVLALEDLAVRILRRSDVEVR